MKKLKIAYNNGLRRLLNLPKCNSAPEMFLNLSIPSFGKLLRTFVFIFKSGITNSDNLLLVNGIVRSVAQLFRKLCMNHLPDGVTFSTYNYLLCNICIYVLRLLLFFKN